MLKNRNFLIVALIAVINALGYGIIIPILYPYSLRFGLSDLQNGLLFSLFSICQFLATPIIGRMSDKYGRKPMLVLSLVGTALSFFIAASAPSAIFLFLARALDGLTAGNIPVVSAVISDTTDLKDRTKGFAVIGAAFGFGFVFGPAISALTVGFGSSIPFVIAGVIALFGTMFTLLLLPETNKHIGEVKKAKLFDFAQLLHALVDKSVGLTLLCSFTYSLAFAMLIFAFQPYLVKIMHLSTGQIASVFTIFGIVGLLTQVFILSKITKKFGEKKVFRFALFLLVFTFLAMFFSRSLPTLIIISILMALFNSFINPLIQSFLSKETDAKSQGTIMGLNASYMSIGNVLGPLIGGLLATFLLTLPFFIGSLLVLICFIISFFILKRGVKKESAF